VELGGGQGTGLGLAFDVLDFLGDAERLVAVGVTPTKSAVKDELMILLSAFE
jgi:hypothetical protein